MATEKILNTRIGLKIDTLANWSKTENQFVLKEGEVAFATVAATAGNGLTEPVIMAKIGDGTNTFNGLGWDFYAKASDVYGWAKKETIEEALGADLVNAIKTDYDFEIVDGKLRVTTNINGTTTTEDFDFVTPTELETALGSYYTKTEVDNKFVAKETGKSLIENTKITKLDGISEGATKVEASATNGNIKIDGVETTVYTLPTINTGVMGVEGQGAIAVVGDSTKTVSLGLDNSGNVTFTQSAGGLKATVDLSGIQTNANAINAIKDDSDIDSFADVKAELAKKQDTILANTYDAYGAADAVLGTSGDAATANTVYGAKAAAAAAQNDATIAKTKIETFLGTVTPDGSQDIIDTLTEINEYVGEHGEEFAALSKKVTDIEDGTTVVPRAGDADTLDGKNSTDFATSAQGALADTALQKADISTGGANGTIAVEGTDVAVKGLGSAAYTEASAYATSAQGAKADNAAAAIATYGDIVTHDADEFKTVQTAVTVPADAAGKFVTSIAQNANGEVSVTYGQISAENIENLEVPSYELVEQSKDAISDINHNGSISFGLKKTTGDNVSYVGSVDLIVSTGLQLTTQSPSINAVFDDMSGSNLISIDDATMAKINGATQNLTNGDASVSVTRESQSGTEITKVSVADGGITTAKIANHAVGAHQTKACQDYSGDDAEVWVFDCGSATVNV